MCDAAIAPSCASVSPRRARTGERPRRRRAARSVWTAFGVVCALGAFATPASAADGVALVVDLPDASPLHRSFASAFVETVGRRWHLLFPGVDPAKASACAADDACLRDGARAVGASHLLTLGIAALDDVEFVVSARLTELGNERDLRNVTEIVSSRVDVAQAAEALATERLLDVEGLPKPRQTPTTTGPATETQAVSREYGGVSPLSLAGYGIGIGAPVLVLLAGLAVAVPVGFAGLHEVATLDQISAVVMPAAAAFMVVGAGIVATDALLPHED